MRPLRMLRAFVRRGPVKAEGEPLDSREGLILVSLNRSWDDKAATRALAAQERHAEMVARRRTGRRS